MTSQTFIRVRLWFCLCLLQSYVLAGHYIHYTQGGIGSPSLIAMLYHWVGATAVLFLGRVACSLYARDCKYGRLTGRQSLSAVVGLSILSGAFPGWMQNRVGLLDTLVGSLLVVYIFAILWWLTQPALNIRTAPARSADESESAADSIEKA